MDMSRVIEGEIASYWRSTDLKAILYPNGAVQPERLN